MPQNSIERKHAMLESVDAIVAAATSFPAVLSLNVGGKVIEDIPCDNPADIKSAVRSYGFRNSIDKADIRPYRR